MRYQNIAVLLPLLCCVSLTAQAVATPEKTDVITYVPAVPSKTLEGSCREASLQLPNSPSAWRCAIGDDIYDPCLTATDGKTIVCGVPDDEFAMKLTEPLPQPNDADGEAEPWMLELADGTNCYPLSGPHPDIEETVKFQCNDDLYLFEELQQDDGGLWQAKKVLVESKENPKDGETSAHITQETLVPILKVWFAGEPTKAAQ